MILPRTTCPGVLRTSALFRINSGTFLLPDIVLTFGSLELDALKL
jgi:hypothetical protein